MNKRKNSVDTGSAIVLIVLILGLYTKLTLFFKLGVLLLFLNMVYPLIYYPLSIVWFGLSKVMGYLVMNIILISLFFLIITPIGLFRRFILKKDSMNTFNFKNNSLVSNFNDRDSFVLPSDIEKPF